MRALRSLLVPVLAAIPALVLAQGNPVSTTAREFAKGAGANLVAAAQAMPAAKYGYKPTAGQWSFAQLVIHIADDNQITCAAIAGAAPADEAKPAPTDPKEKLVAALQRSIAACDTALSKVSDATLGDTVTYYGDKAPRVAAVMGLVADWFDHYGQQAMYLRLNGVLPPTARKSGM